MHPLRVFVPLGLIVLRVTNTPHFSSSLGEGGLGWGDCWLLFSR